MHELTTPVQYLRGVGPKRAEDLAGCGIFTLEDLLYNLPYRYEDRTHFKQVRDLVPGEKTSILVHVLVCGMVVTKKSRTRIYEVAARDESGIIHAKWFHAEYLERSKVFKPGQQVVFYGKFERDPFSGGRFAVINPEFEILKEDKEEIDSTEMNRIVPVYEAIRGCSSKFLRRLTGQVFESVESIPETLPRQIMNRRGLMSRPQAFAEAHFPPSDTDTEALAVWRTPALTRLIFEELFFLEVGLALKRRQARAAQGFAFQVTPAIREAVKRILPFHPTQAQKRVLKEIVDDLCRPMPMNRLLQGDVGCGKTIVALESAAVAIENGYQVALLAPTEILAEQHFFNTKRIFEKNGYRAGLLKSGMKKKERDEQLRQLNSGELQLIIGTHALLEPDVLFHRLGLVLIDEQHRFGVMQRFGIMKKGSHPHTLVMTATPIPRTLAMTLYGDLDVSVIDELPPHRSPVVTQLVRDRERLKAYQFVREQVRLGRQAYVVCPLVEESEKIDLRAACETYEHLARVVFPGCRVDLLHGRMKSEEKEAVMRRFTSGEAQILVATTVVEVGVDVANASLMMIEHAERFGLSQLHQLRGRIGRGSVRSFALLMCGDKLSGEARERLECMVETSDGFKIAEKDLQLRGPGEFFGTRQSGLPSLRVANLLRDGVLLEEARQEALNYVEKPDSETEYQDFLKQLKSSWQRRYGLVAVG
jgi:ATP-dependent DNA helicase RecG